MQTSNPGSTLARRQDSESVQRLLAALGDWGVAEEDGASNSALDLLFQRAASAYAEVATAA